jgi:ADP-ribose pyrophosphatase YjhB (NUDIX family)
VSGTTQKAVGAVIFDGQGRVLLVLRGKPPLRGTWTLPGGRTEPGESPEAAVEREVLEETGLAVQAQRLVQTVIVREEGFAYEIDDYLCRQLPAATTTPRAGDDALDVRWASRSELESLGVRALAIEVIDRATRLVTGST